MAVERANMPATMSEYVLTLLSPQEVRAHWAEIGPLLKKAERFSGGEILAEDIPEMVDAHRAFVMALVKGEEIVLAGALEALMYPRKHVLNIILLGGRDLHVVPQQFMDGVREVASRLGASAVRGCVRPEMARLARRLKPDSKILYSVTEFEL